MTAVAVLGTVVVLWGLVSGRLERADLTAPIVFVVVGGLCAAVGLVEGPEASAAVAPLVEVTLVLVLFSDAATVPLAQLRGDLGRVVRLLAVGLPLTVLAGWAVADVLFPGLGVWLALLVGAALAPTDAALGLPVVTNPGVPADVRRLITIESGLNDGIATPVVVFALAGAAAAEHVDGSGTLAHAVAELGIGVAVGITVGGAGGWALQWAQRRGWEDWQFIGIAVLALAIVAYAGALAVHGNGFVAAFCGGLAFGAASGPRAPAELVFLEESGGLLSLVVWFVFGLQVLPIIVDGIEWRTVRYGVLSLTVLRMVPVALACVGAGLDRGDVLFVGWFGPRGLASLVFALLALEELGSDADLAVTIIGATVLMSVLAHGLSAAPLVERERRRLIPGR